MNRTNIEWTIWTKEDFQEMPKLDDWLYALGIAMWALFQILSDVDGRLWPLSWLVFLFWIAIVYAKTPYFLVEFVEDGETYDASLMRGATLRMRSLWYGRYWWDPVVVSGPLYGSELENLKRDLLPTDDEPTAAGPSRSA